MALFRRSKPDQSALPEVDKYYDGERRDRASLAWLLAFASVAVAGVLIVGLFYAGRWAYREVTEDDTNVAVTQDVNSNTPSFDGNSQTDESSDNSSSNQSGNSDTSEESSSQDQAETDSSNTQTGDEEISGNVNAPATTDSPSSEVPATGDNPDPLPATGPEGIIALTTVVSVLAGSAHYVILRKKA